MANAIELCRVVMEADPDLFGLETGTIEEAAQTLEQVHNVRPEPPPDSDETAWAVCPVCGFHATSGWPGISAHLGVTEASGRPGCRLLYRVLMKRANPLLGRQSLPRSAWEIEETPVDEEGAPAGAAAGDAAGDDGDAAGGAEGDAAGGPAATTPRLRRRAAPPRSSPRPRSASKLPPGEVLLRYRVVRRACDRAEDTRRSRLQRARGDDGDDSDASGDFGAVPGCQGSSAGGDDGDGSPGRAGGRRSRGRERTASRAGRAAAAAAAAAMAAAGLGGSSSESGEQEDSSDGAWGRGGDDDSSEGDGDEGPSDVEAEAARARAEEEEEEAAAAAEGEDWDDDDGGLRPMDSSPSGTGVSAGARRGRRASRGPVAPPRELDLGGLFSVRAARRVSGRVSGATAARLLRERSAHSVFLAAAFASGVNMVPPAAKLKLGPCPAVWSDGVSLGFAPFAALASAAREEQVPEACIAPSPQAPPLSSSSPPSSSEPASDSDGEAEGSRVDLGAPAAVLAPAFVAWAGSGAAITSCDWSPLDPGLILAGTADGSVLVFRCDGMDGAAHWEQECSPHDAAASGPIPASSAPAAAGGFSGASALPASAPCTRRLLPLSVMRPAFLSGISSARSALVSVSASPADANYVLASSAELGAAMYSVLEAGRAVTRLRPNGPTCTRAALFGSGCTFALGSTSGQLFLGSVGQSQRLMQPGAVADGLAAVSDLRVFPTVGRRHDAQGGTAIVVALTDGTVLAVPELPGPELKATTTPGTGAPDPLGSAGQGLLLGASTRAAGSEGKAGGGKAKRGVCWRLHDLSRLVLAGPSPNVASLVQRGVPEKQTKSKPPAPASRRRSGRAAKSGRRGRRRRPALESSEEEQDEEQSDDEDDDDDDYESEGGAREALPEGGSDGEGKDPVAADSAGDAASLVPSMLWRRSALAVAGGVVGAGEGRTQVVAAGFGDRTVTLWFLDPL
ncbi:hypothetical protein FNF29_03637 [Cafeteria roenbergensis]|uniref:Uncharacterized protein n=1 Tax=Cafeteria roenbergensis TaxID=33653 RepID=A0A5A8CIT1_CAFRO|nr:hypothetical protein FNF29_03637 [Cafeteria roenbergensis]|eukprot:KAA0152748.1 hypothetical protein FNF29_03637 [Cafeteria roenbergensis]